MDDRAMEIGWMLEESLNFSLARKLTVSEDILDLCEMRLFLLVTCICEGRK